MKISWLFLISAVACAIVWCLCVYKIADVEVQSKIWLQRAAIVQKDAGQLHAKREALEADAKSWGTLFRAFIDGATWGKTSRDGTIFGEDNRLNNKNDYINRDAEKTSQALDQLRIDGTTLIASYNTALWWRNAAFVAGIICGLGCVVARRYEAATAAGSWSTKESHTGQSTTDANKREQNATAASSLHRSTEHTRQVLSAGATVVSYTTIVQCPRCGQKLRVRGDVAIRVHCKACGTHFDKQPGPGTA